MHQKLACYFHCPKFQSPNSVTLKIASRTSPPKKKTTTSKSFALQATHRRTMQAATWVRKTARSPYRPLPAPTGPGYSNRIRVTFLIPKKKIRKKNITKLLVKLLVMLSLMFFHRLLGETSPVLWIHPCPWPPDPRAASFRVPMGPPKKWIGTSNQIGTSHRNSWNRPIRTLGFLMLSYHVFRVPHGHVIPGD